MEHALLLGGTRGLGRAVAWLLAPSIPRLSVVARQAAAPGQLPPEARTWVADLTDATATTEALRRLLGENGPLSRVVFLARYRGPAPDWDGELALGLTATRRIVDELVRDHGLSNCGVVMVSSLAARLVSPQATLEYHVAKAGLVQLARYYAVRLGRRGIRVNAVCPGLFLKAESQQTLGADPARRAACEAATALGRIGTAEEVARVIAFLSGPEASFITGQAVIVDGGASLRYYETLDGHSQAMLREPCHPTSHL